METLVPLTSRNHHGRRHDDQKAASPLYLRTPDKYTQNSPRSPPNVPTGHWNLFTSRENTRAPSTSCSPSQSQHHPTHPTGEKSTKLKLCIQMPKSNVHHWIPEAELSTGGVGKMRDIILGLHGLWETVAVCFFLSLPDGSGFWVIAFVTGQMLKTIGSANPDNTPFSFSPQFPYFLNSSIFYIS